MPEALTEALDALGRHDWETCRALALDLHVDDPASEASRLDVLAEASWWLGRLDECIDARSAAYQAYEELGDHRKSGQCAVWLYEHHNMGARPSMASAWLQRARRALEAETDCVEHGALLLREAELAHGGGRLEDAGDLAQRALRLGRDLASADLEARRSRRSDVS